MHQEYIKLNANEFSEQKAFWESQIDKGQSTARFKLFAPSGKKKFVQKKRNFSQAFRKFDKEIQSNSNAMYVILVTAMGLIHRYYGQAPINFHLQLKNFINEENPKPLPLVVDEFSNSSLEQLKIIQEKINRSIAFRDFPVQLLCEELNASEALHSNIMIGDYMATHDGYDLCIIFDDSDHKKSIKAAIRHGVGNQSWLTTYLKHLDMAIQLLADDKAELDKLQLCDVLSSKFDLQEAQGVQFQNIIAQFESITERFPDKLAVKSDDEKVSYAELNYRANRIASEVFERWGGSPNFIVGLFLEKGSWSIACMLGVLKAGGAYLPMDVDTPISRLEQIVENSGMNGLISISDQMFNVQEIDIESLYIDIEYDSFGEQYANVSESLVEGQLAYVIYTSGSTGKPKGVKIGHNNIINTLQWRQDFYQFDENHACLQLASHSFDSSVEDIYGMLLSGGTVIIPIQEKKTDADYLIGLLIADEVSHLLIVPSLYRIILNELQQDLPHLEAVTVAGEATNDDLVRRHFDQLSNTRLINEYGPTECSVCATFKELMTGSPVTIGQPITNTRAAVVNEQLKLLPAGIKGELLLGGPGVAQGYIGDLKLNHQKFIEDTIFNNGQKLYKTGDLVRWNLIGELEFVGRIDDQVKIRGLRVEPAEISKSLGLHPSIDQGVVIARVNDSKEYELLAFYMADKALSNQQLRDFMSQHVIRSLIPSQFVHLDTFPLNTNGKIDHQKLATLDIASISKEKYARAETDLQNGLVKIWEEVLNQNGIGIEDDFFELGGHSLRATTFISEARKQLGVSLTINEVFAHTTIKSLSELIEKQKFNIQHYEIDHLTDKDNYCLSPGQLRLWVMLLEEGNGANYRMDCLYRLEGDLNAKAFERAVQDIFQRHDSLRTRFIGSEEQTMQHFPEYDATKVPFTYELLEGVSEEEALEKLNKEKREAFDLFESELVKVRLVKIDTGTHLFLLSMHHIISDGWSIGVLIGELMNGYNHRVNDLFYEHPGIAINYGDYAEWISKQVETGGFEREKQYWLKQLGDVKEIAELPADRSRPERKNYKAGNEYFNLDSSHYDSIKALEYKEGLSTFMIMLASLGLLVSYHSSKSLFTLGSPFTGRTEPGLKDLIGILINTLALRIEIKTNQLVSEYLQSIKKSVLDGIEHQLYPFDQILQDLELPRNPNKTPLFEVGLTWQNHDNIPDQLSLVGLSAEQILEETPLAQHDLWFYGTELDGIFSFDVIYSKELFDIETIKVFIDDFVTISTMLSKSSSEKVQHIFEQLKGANSRQIGVGTFVNLHEDF